MLSEAGKHYGEGIIEKYSIKLKSELNKKYNIATLKRMRQFYYIIEKGATMSHQLSFSHYVELLPQDDLNKVNYYINEVKTGNLTVTELRKEHIGQIQTYMNYIDKNLKTIYQDKTIGIILVKRNNKFIIEYTSDDRIISRNYEII